MVLFSLPFNLSTANTHIPRGPAHSQKDCCYPLEWEKTVTLNFSHRVNIPLSFPNCISPEYRDGIDIALCLCGLRICLWRERTCSPPSGSRTSVLPWSGSIVLTPLTSYNLVHSLRALLEGSRSLIRLNHFYLDSLNQCGNIPKPSIMNC